MIANNLRLVLRTRSGLLGFWGHGANFQAVGGNGWRERLKACTIGLSDWWFAYTALSVERLLAAGYPKERITCLNNAVDTAQLGRWRQEITESEIEKTRRSLGLRGRHTAVFIGSLHPHKRLDFLLQAADRLRDELGDFELIVIGDGLLKPMLLAHASSLEWLKVVGPKHGRDKVLHAALGDVILNPGMVGLGILDSFSLGLPLVTTDCGIHSPEIAYLRPGQNGVITPNDVGAYVFTVASLLRDRRLLASLVAGSREDAARYTVEGMATNFVLGVQAALEHGKRP
jgi:glycosyltransferase involved in cell wall biosynthesis